MGRPIKERRGDAAPKGVNIKKAEILDRLAARSRRTGAGYTEIVGRALDALDAAEASATPREKLDPAEVARRRAALANVQRLIQAKKADFAARGEPWPAGDHGDMYDEYGLPK